MPQDLGKGYPCVEASLEGVSEVLAMKSVSRAFMCPSSLPLPHSSTSGTPQQCYIHSIPPWHHGQLGIGVITLHQATQSSNSPLAHSGAAAPQSEAKARLLPM